MPTATPDSLDTVVAQIVTEMQQMTDAQRQTLDDVFEKVGALGEQARDLPADAWNALRHITDHPDWYSLLLLIVVKLSELDDHLSVGAMQPVGWSRMITLTYTVDDQTAATLGVAIIQDHDGQTPLKRGLSLRVHKGLDLDLPLVGGIGLALHADGESNWDFEFGQPVHPPEKAAQVVATISWNPPDLHVDPVAVTTGTASATVALKSPAEGGGKPYAITVALGDPTSAATAGFRAHIDIGRSLGALADVIAIAAIDEQYSPAYTRPTVGAPTFQLNHRSA